MTNAYPKTIPIRHDDYHAQHIGKMKNGNQFFLTAPFIPARNTPGCEFIAMYIFDKSGALINHEIENLGPRSTIDKDVAQKIYIKMLDDLGDVEFSDIMIEPFSIKAHDTEFGLIKRDPSEGLALVLLPGNYMAFFEPWDGYYDT